MGRISRVTGVDTVSDVGSRLLENVIGANKMLWSDTRRAMQEEDDHIPEGDTYEERWANEMARRGKTPEWVAERIEQSYTAFWVMVIVMAGVAAVSGVAWVRGFPWKEGHWMIAAAIMFGSAAAAYLQAFGNWMMRNRLLAGNLEFIMSGDWLPKATAAWTRIEPKK